MMRRSISLLLMLMVLPAFAEEIVTPAPPFTGWSWYNEPKKAPAPPPVQPQPQPQKPRVPDMSNMTAQEQTKVLRQYTMEALSRALLNPTRENTATYLKWQKFWTDRSSLFSQSFAAAQLEHPELDYNLEYPHYNSTAPLIQARDQQRRQDAIAKMGQQYGLFYFYRGSDPIDALMAGVVADFAKTNHLSLIPVSIDGKAAPSLPDSRPDNGQVEAMRISHFPALFLVDPRSRNFQPLVYGFMTQDDLAKRFLNVSTGFKPNF
ncbi:type-F conjugative transfer system pilin assembly protein TraF [Kosakonia cowanii]|uniref:type-F conjugative transfer system pilin assembly protein TraF n=1 Tax=Kosakonia cowanii TaxID=208223 RepID=UPI0023F84892|nr:type-F conjugative transfer system pilin assembly protein TraF [Kosakonia cowanii]MDF7758942.1 type-F conjugative transfer system pilin assembly protein TraF [Kosakonia cowanii]